MSREVIYRVQLNSKDMPNFATAEEIEPMSVWCMKCLRNGECMVFEKPKCFEMRAEQTEAHKLTAEQLMTECEVQSPCEVCSYKNEEKGER